MARVRWPTIRRWWPRVDHDAEPERPVDPDREVIGASGLFDANHYLIEGRDVRDAGVDPLDHYCRHGSGEGRRPNLYFDPAWYRLRHLAGSAPDTNPLAHYVVEGEAAGLRPVCYFDPGWYRRTYGLPDGVSPLRHYLTHRRSQRFAPNPHFDVPFYLARHGAEIGPNRDPFAHFLRCGADRDIDPSPTFSSAAYRARHMPGPASTERGLSFHERRVPLVHFLDSLAP